MRIPERLQSKLEGFAFKRIKTRPDFVIGSEDNPYLKRWWIISRNHLFNIYLHQFLRSDDDRALHDHPWFNCSILLNGEYIEHTKKTQRYRFVGHIYFRHPWIAHRVELLTDKKIFSPVLTLFITGPRMRNWGFHCPQGWRRWQDFVSIRDGGNDTGVGCN